MKYPIRRLLPLLLLQVSSCAAPVDAEEYGDTVSPLRAPPPATVFYATYPDDRNGATLEDRYLGDIVASFQGAVNQTGPILFLLRTPSDRHWLAELDARYPDTQFQSLDSALEGVVGPPTLEQLETHVRNILSRPELRARTGRYLLYSRSQPGSAINNVIPFAGIYRAVIVEKQHEDLIRDLGFTIASEAPQGGDFSRFAWSNDNTVRRWAFDELRNDDRISRRFYAMNRGYVPHVTKGIPDPMRGLDFMVQARMLTFFLDRGNDYDLGTARMDEILDLYPDRSIAFGWWGEEIPDVLALSQRGHTVAGHGANISFLRWLEPENGIRRGRFQTELPAYRRNRTYVAISFTQGDAMHFCQRENLAHLTAMTADGEERIAERYPFGLMQSTLQYDLQPTVADGIHALLTPRQSMMGKGYGYNFPSQFENGRTLRRHANRARSYLEHFGYRDLFINDQEERRHELWNGQGLTRSILRTLANRTDARSIFLKHPFETTPELQDEQPFLVGDANTVVFHDPVTGVLAPHDSNGDGQIDDNDRERFDPAGTAAAVRRSARHRQFFWVFMQNISTIQDFEQLADALTVDADRNEGIVLVTPDELVRLYRAECLSNRSRCERDGTGRAGNEGAGATGGN